MLGLTRPQIAYRLKRLQEVKDGGGDVASEPLAATGMSPI
jgi:hypothetical protein